jgi:hypothetical protein
MRRTQLYLQESIWKSLHLRSKREGKTISELVRQAVKDKYGKSSEDRRAAMLGVVGLWKDRQGIADSTSYVRKLRKGKRLKRLSP